MPFLFLHLIFYSLLIVYDTIKAYINIIRMKNYFLNVFSANFAYLFFRLVKLFQKPQEKGFKED